MLGQYSRSCCKGRVAASILPGALLILLPKCPLCLAAWLTVVTGIGVSAGAVAQVRGLILAFWAAAVTFGVAQFLRRRARGSLRLWTSNNCWKALPGVSRPVRR